MKYLYLLKFLMLIAYTIFMMLAFFEGEYAEASFWGVLYLLMRN